MPAAESAAGIILWVAAGGVVPGDECRSVAAYLQTISKIPVPLDFDRDSMRPEISL
jgi:hypothetical protein